MAEARAGVTVSDLVLGQHTNKNLIGRLNWQSINRFKRWVSVRCWRGRAVTPTREEYMGDDVKRQAETFDRCERVGGMPCAVAFGPTCMGLDWALRGRGWTEKSHITISSSLCMLM